MLPNSRRCVTCKNHNSATVHSWIISPFMIIFCKKNLFRSVTLFSTSGYSNNCTHMLPNSRRCVACKNHNSTTVCWWIISLFMINFCKKNVLPLCYFVMHKGKSNNCTHMLPNTRQRVPCKNHNSATVNSWIISLFMINSWQKKSFRSVTLLYIRGYSNNCTDMLPNSRRCVGCKNHNSWTVHWWIISPFMINFWRKKKFRL